MNINGKEITTRHCPFCGKLLDKIEYRIDAWEEGRICHKEVSDPSFLDTEAEETTWKETDDDTFFCGYCNETITNSLPEAKEFISLPDEEKFQIDYNIRLYYCLCERNVVESKSDGFDARDKLVETLINGCTPFEDEQPLEYYLDKIGIDECLEDEIIPVSERANKFFDEDEDGDGYNPLWRCRIID